MVYSLALLAWYQLSLLVYCCYTEFHHETLWKPNPTLQCAPATLTVNLYHRQMQLTAQNVPMLYHVSTLAVHVLITNWQLKQPLNQRELILHCLLSLLFLLMFSCSLVQSRPGRKNLHICFIFQVWHGGGWGLRGPGWKVVTWNHADQRMPLPEAGRVGAQKWLKGSSCASWTLYMGLQCPELCLSPKGRSGAGAG